MAQISSVIQAAAMAVLAGQAVTDQNVSVTREDFYHRQTITTTANKLTFFNASEAEHTTNWPSPSGLPDDHLFIANGLRCDVDHQYDAAGAAQSAGVPYAATAAPLSIFMDYLALVKHGLVKLLVGTQRVCEFYGIYKAPAGGGVELDSNHNNTTANTLSSVVNMRNGTPHDTNGYQIPPTIIGPGRQVRLTNAWNFSRTLTSNSALTIKWELFGTLIRPANA